MTLVVGLTGGIGSGKSAVADEFGRLGADVTDTDRISHRLTLPGGEGHAAIVAAFGRAILGPGAAIDRAALRRRVFDDPSERKRLESILHPLIRAEALREIAAWKGPYGIVVVPLLLERGGLAGVVTRILVVDCAEEQQIARVMRRSGLAEADVRAIMATQLPRAERLRAADDVIDNSGPADAIPPAVAALDLKYRAIAGATGLVAR